MYERCLNETERLLATSKSFILPIKEVWKMMSAEGKRRSFDVPALTDFDALLEGDKRFEIISAQTEPDMLESPSVEDEEEIDSNLGTLGFYPEDRVKLRRIRLPGARPGAVMSSKELEEDEEEVVPFNVKGLSATRPVHRVEVKKKSPQKTNTKPTPRSRSSSRSRAKKNTGRAGRTRKAVRKSSRKNR